MTDFDFEEISIYKSDLKMIIDLINENNKILEEYGYAPNNKTIMLINRLKNKLGEYNL